MKKSYFKHNGFTLIEMLVVLVIIGMLAGLVGPKMFGRVDSSKIKSTEVQIKMLKGAVETFRLDVGRYPTQAEGLLVLNMAPADEKSRVSWRGPYLDEQVPLDPWGNNYIYTIPGSNGQPYLLYSYGADGEKGGEGNNADIGSTGAQK